MHMHDMPIRAVAGKARTHRHAHHHYGQTHFWRDPLSRRQFIRTAVGAMGVGTALGTGLWRPGLVQAQQAPEPVPIPGGSPVLGGEVRVFGPGFPDFDPPDAEPSTITDFNGFLGLAYISGEVTRTNTATGEVRTLPFVNNDMRFVQGLFRGIDGQLHQGTFAFI